MPIDVVEADLSRPAHQQAIVALTNDYAADAMGNGAPLTAEVSDALVDGLRAHPTTVVFLAYSGSEPVGIATCFVGFSTFAARPLINIHDLAVTALWRGQGVARALLAAVERHGRALGCAKLTLEVGDRNERARAVYESAGFEQAVYGQQAGRALFYTKWLK